MNADVRGVPPERKEVRFEADVKKRPAQWHARRAKKSGDKQ